MSHTKAPLLKSSFSVHHPVHLDSVCFTRPSPPIKDGPYVGYESHEGIQSLQVSPLPGTRGEGAFRIRCPQGTETGAKAEVGGGIRTRIHLRRLLAIFSKPHTHAPFVVAHFGPSVHIQVAHAVS